MYRTGSVASYHCNDKSIGKIFSFSNRHIRSDFTLRDREIARGVIWIFSVSAV